jgi:hypothetical protein
VSDVRALAPVTEEDFARVLDFIEAHRATWEALAAAGLQELVRHLRAAGCQPSTVEERPDVASGRGALEAGEVVVSGRLKDSSAIVAKRRRFGEPLRVMLDVWGYRAVVATERELDAIAARCAELWETPAPEEVLLRHGTLQFDWWRDYRRRDHTGLSAATTAHYDQAIHLNRRAPFGIVEIQVLTFELYRRVHCDPASEDSHDRFVARREELLRGGGQ